MKRKGKVVFKLKDNRKFSDKLADWVYKYLTRKSESLQSEYKSKMVVYAHDLVGNYINVFGVYEKKQLTLLINFLKHYNLHNSKHIALDVGANVGNHTLFFAKYYKQVFAYEPLKTTFRILQLNTENVENIIPLNYGLSDKEMTLSMEKSLTNMGGSRVTESGNNNSNCEMAEFKTLDSIEFDDTIGLIKVDVEGHELPVIKGGIKLIKKHKPIILFELFEDGYEDGKSVVAEQLKQIGYSKFGVIQRDCKSKIRAIDRISNFIVRRNLELKLFNIEDIPVKNYAFIIAIPDNKLENIETK